MPRLVPGTTIIWYSQDQTVFNRIKLVNDGDCLSVLNSTTNIGLYNHSDILLELTAREREPYISEKP